MNHKRFISLRDRMLTVWGNATL